MFDDTFEVSSDLEWMLQSGQANIPRMGRALVRALVREHYQRIFDQALAQLAYPEEAHLATEEILLAAVRSADQYPADLGVQGWLESIAAPIIQKHKEEIEQVSLLNPLLNRAILKRYPVEELTPAGIEQAGDRLIDQVITRRSSMTRWASAQETIIACLAVLLVFGLLRIAGIFPPAGQQPPAAGQRASNPAQDSIDPASPDQVQSGLDGLRGGADAQDLVHDLPFHPLRGLPPQAPLSKESSHDDVWRRMLLSRFLWHTLRADLVVVLYGPEGYIGPPQAERHQVWIEQDERALLVSGQPFFGPERVELITPQGTFPQLTPFLQGVADISRLGSQIPWFYLSEETIFSSPYLINFFFIGHYDWPPRIKEFEIIGEDRWAGRAAVVVEQSNNHGRLEARLWLDAATGLILREQYFAPDDPDQILLETVVTAVAFNQEFPDELFTSPKNYADWSSQGETRTSQTFSPEGVLYPWLANVSLPENSPQPPPSNFDPSGSQLRFRYSRDIYFGPARATEVHVLADDFSLGKIKINHLFKTTCIRSPDGKMIGLFTQEEPPSLLTDLFNLYHLADLKLIPLTFPGNLLVRAAFSPDSRTLAVAGIDVDTLQSSITLVDLETEERVETPRMEPVWSLAWSPDGRQLAALHWPSFRQSSEYAVQITVYDLEEKQNVRQYLAADLDWGAAEITIPLEDWQASFPLPMGGLEACAAAP